MRLQTVEITEQRLPQPLTHPTGCNSRHSGSLNSTAAFIQNTQVMYNLMNSTITSTSSTVITTHATYQKFTTASNSRHRQCNYKQETVMFFRYDSLLITSS